MDHLKEIFGNPPPPLVIMLQEVHRQSLEAILNHSWIRENFVLSNTDAPRGHFTLMMVSQHIQAKRWFRVPFLSHMRRDALVVDIPISSLGGGSEHLQKCLRLCTMHLESSPEGNELRPSQLAQVSALLKAPPTRCTQIVGGLIGGDMNSTLPLEADSHRASDVDLRDVWEDTTPPPLPILKPFQRDRTYGRAKGITSGYQSRRASSRKRLDKFLYTGSVDTIPLFEAQDLSGKVGRLGIDIKTKIMAWEYVTKWAGSVNGRIIQEPRKWHFDAEKRFMEDGVFKEVDVWVSNHFGIAVGIRVC